VCMAYGLCVCCCVTIVICTAYRATFDPNVSVVERMRWGTTGIMQSERLHGIQLHTLTSTTAAVATYEAGVRIACLADSA